MLAALREKEGTVSVSEKAIGVFSLRAEEPHLTRNDVTGHFFVLVGVWEKGFENTPYKQRG